MIYVYRRAASEGANELVEDICLLGTRARRTQGQLLRNVVAGDCVVCWGDALPNGNRAGARTLNNQPIVSKFDEAQKLQAARVPTITVSRQKPVAPRRVAFEGAKLAIPGVITLEDGPVLVQKINAFIASEAVRKNQYNRQPVNDPNTWLPRRNNHIGGTDLLHPPAQPDYYSKKEDIVDEYRLHMFKGKSIRAGRKVQRPNRPNGGASHPWIRSFDAGWIIAYADFASTKVMRQIAQAAIDALGLDFGAVDIGKRADGTLIVLEVNRAPGVEGGTSEAYARKIIAWSQGA